MSESGNGDRNRGWKRANSFHLLYSLPFLLYFQSQTKCIFISLRKLTLVKECILQNNYKFLNGAIHFVSLVTEIRGREWDKMGQLNNALNSPVAFKFRTNSFQYLILRKWQFQRSKSISLTHSIALIKRSPGNSCDFFQILDNTHEFFRYFRNEHWLEIYSLRGRGEKVWSPSLDNCIKHQRSCIGEVSPIISVQSFNVSHY